MPSIAGINLPWGQEKKSGSGSGTDPSGGGAATTTGSNTTGNSETTGQTETATSAPAEPLPVTSPQPAPPTSAPADPLSGSGEPSRSFSGAVNQVTPMPPSLRELLAQEAAITVTPLGRLAEALRAANDQLNPVEPLAPELLYRTAARIMAEASSAMVAQATHSEKSVMALLREA